MIKEVSQANNNVAPIPILYEDNHLLVVEKPVNMLSQADFTKDPDILSILKQDLKQRYNKLGRVYLGLVHRLDRPVGGVMVFAKTSKAAARLSKQIRELSFTKVYLAVVQGVLANLQGELVHYLNKDRRKNIVKITDYQKSGSKVAVLNYQVLDLKHDQTLVKVHLKTGRAHQIRVQFAAINHPLVGDQKYGRSTNQRRIQIALWSYLIGFDHPTTKERLEFSCLPPVRKYPWNLFGNHWIERM